MIQERQLFDPQRIPSKMKTIFLVPEKLTYKITKPEVFNLSNNVQRLIIWVVPPGGVASDDNLHAEVLIPGRQNSVLKSLVGTNLNAGWSIVMVGQENNQATIKISARVS